MNPWRHKHMLPRPILLGRSTYRKWTITPPSALAGTGVDEEKSVFVAIPDPQPTGVQLFAVPNMSIETDGGGALAAAVEFWGDGEAEEDENGLLSTAALAALSSFALPVRGWTDYDLPDIRLPAITGTGRVSSPWHDLSTPIPAGTGFLLGPSSYPFGSAGCVILITDTSQASAAAIAGCLELENVGEIPLYSFNSSAGAYGGTQSAGIQPSSGVFQFTASDVVTKCRAHVDVSTLTNCTAGASVDHVTARRVYS